MRMRQERASAVGKERRERQRVWRRGMRMREDTHRQTDSGSVRRRAGHACSGDV
jgi:hypothetical protein